MSNVIRLRFVRLM
uniref:Uncharacterized protein n=1 Tax=Anguilla anguilla TaxID=7936 RepID=A0A0E9VI38_ANGAN